MSIAEQLQNNYKSTQHLSNMQFNSLKPAPAFYLHPSCNSQVKLLSCTELTSRFVHTPEQPRSPHGQVQTYCNRLYLGCHLGSYRAAHTRLRLRKSWGGAFLAPFSDLVCQEKVASPEIFENLDYPEFQKLSIPKTEEQPESLSTAALVDKADANSPLKDTSLQAAGDRFSYEYPAGSGKIVYYDILTEPSNGNPGTVTTAAGSGVGQTPNIGVSGAVTIPSTVKWGASSYTVTETGPFSFAGNTVITSLELPSSLQTVRTKTATSCTSLTSVSMPEGVERLDDFAMYGNGSLESVSLPASVISLGLSPFGRSSALTAIEVSLANPAYCEIDGVLYTKDRSLLVQYPIGNKASSFTVPDFVTRIGSHAFIGSSYLSSILVSDSVQASGPCVFESFARLDTVVLGAGLMEISQQMFSRNSTLSSIISYSNVSSIFGEPSSIDRSAAFFGVNKANVTVLLPTGTVGGKALAQRQEIWQNAGFTKFATAPNKVITFDPQGGSAVASQTAAPGAQATLPVPPTRTGYTFTKWFTDPACTSEYNFNTAITESITLYAGWKLNTYDVVFNPNGASNTMAPQTITYSVTTSLNANTLTRPGYTFTGWAKSATGAVEYADQASVTSLTSEANGQVNLYAKWEANSYALAFDSNGGTGAAMAQVNRTYDDAAVVLPATTFAKTGYTFAGWNTQANGGGTAYSATGAYNNFTTIAGAKVTLFAQWKANTYNVIFNPNGASNTMSDFKKTYNDNASLPKCTLTRPGYIFSKWNTKSDGIGTNYNDEATDNLTTTTDPITLYAQWTPILSASVPIKVLATVDGSGNVAFTDTPTIPAQAPISYTYGIESRSPVDLKVTKISLDYLAGAATVFPEGRENVAIKVSGIAINPDVPFVPDSLLALRAAGSFRVPAATYGESGSVTPGKLSLPLALDLGGTRVTHLADTSTEIATLTYTIDFAEKG